MSSLIIEYFLIEKVDVIDNRFADNSKLQNIFGDNTTVITMTHMLLLVMMIAAMKVMMMTMKQSI